MEQLRIGVIGVSGRGELAQYLHDPAGRSVVVGGTDISSTALQSFQEKIQGNVFVTNDYRKLLERDDIDAIMVTSPDYCHEEHAIAAFAAGKHVFCEKPLAITVEGCDRILRAWQRSGKKFMVGFNLRYANVFRTAKEIIDSGTIGVIKAVWVRHFVGHGGNFYYHDWHAKRTNTTSLLLQKGSHDIDIVHWLCSSYGKRTAAFGSLDFFGGDKPNDLTCPECNERESCPDVGKVNTRMQCAFRQEVDVEDNHVVIFELENGVKAAYLQCHFTPDYVRNYTFIGTEGRLECSFEGTQVIVKLRESNKWKSLADRVYEVKPSEGGHGGADPIICKDFVDMVLDGREPYATPLAGRMSVAVGCAATESLRNGGRVVEVPALPEDLKALY